MFSRLCLSFTDDSWEMLQDSNNQHLLIGFFQFHKKAASTDTETNRWGARLGGSKSNVINLILR
jgi:hypothetical protein